MIQEVKFGGLDTKTLSLQKYDGQLPDYYYRNQNLKAAGPLRGFLHDKYHHDLLITSDSRLVSVLSAVFDVAGHNIVMKKLEYAISIKGNALY